MARWDPNLRSPANAYQPLDLHGLRWYTTSGAEERPGNLDACLDFRGRGLILIEVKHLSTGVAELEPEDFLPTGQRLLYERVTDACAAGGLGEHAMTLVASHEYPPEVAVPVHELPVQWVRINGVWRRPTRQVTVWQAANNLRKRVVPEHS